MIKDVLKALREEKGFKKSETASALGMPYTTYNNYEVGTREPGSDALILISSYYDVSIDYLLGRTDERKKTVPTEDGLSDDNVKFREYSMIYDNLRARLIQEGILGENDDFTPDLLKLFLLLGEDTAIKVLKAKGIDPAALIK